MRSLWRVGARWPTGPYMCSRRSTSFTGLPTNRAARMPSTCGPEIRPFEPKPPPKKGLRIWIFSGEMPKSPASRPWAMARPWLGVSIESVSPLVVLQEIEPEHEGVRLRVRVLSERRPVGRRHDFDDTGVALGSLHVEEAHATARDAADSQNGMEHSGRVVIRGVAGFSLDF